eukprot:TRINITY_DN4282_c0_g1_i2.p2 TRINITY_DN4282_c0_g1~~TRINITY_DN4282_c0_g1_i2.p2  ORF type:complete len:181 (-),score=46.58 TRINITY_DN4282_c0_g1_i2:335-877(-)
MKLAWLLQPALSAWILQGASLDEAAAEQGLLAEEESSCRNGREDCSLQLLQRQASAFAGEPLDSDLDDDTVAQASAKEEGCSQADAQAIFSRGFGVGPESLPSQVMNCTQTSWGVWDMQEGKFNTCMKPLSKSCSKCFMSYVPTADGAKTFVLTASEWPLPTSRLAQRFRCLTCQDAASD